MTSRNKITFSVVIPLYNKREHILRTLDSVLRQSNNDFEIIVVDDGSTDGGPNLVEREYEHTVNLVRQPNGGVSAARNRGVEVARGEIIAFLDADDTWEPHFLSEIASMAHAFPDAGAFGTNYQFVVGEDSYIDPKIRFPKKTVKPRVLDDYFDIGARGDLPFMMSSFCIKRDVFLFLGKFQQGVAMGEDQDLFCRVALNSSIAYSPSVLSFYHLDASNRACNQLVPEEECGFSKRVKAHAKGKTEPEKRDALLRYSCAHLLHIASLNIRMQRYEIAKQILSDEVCRLQPLRYIWWQMNCWIGSFRRGEQRLQ
jgi:glycosyltransferase involved in cell wall biosynthesis